MRILVVDDGGIALFIHVKGLFKRDSESILHPTERDRSIGFG